MITIDSKYAHKYKELGLWGDNKLDIILLRMAFAFPEQLVFEDDITKSNYMDGKAKRYTLGKMEACVRSLASIIKSWGLKDGALIAVQLPNITEANIINLAIWRAGYAVIAVPEYWQEHELRINLYNLAPAAIISLSRYKDYFPLKNICSFAQKLALKCRVASISQDCPDGVINLSACFDSEKQQFESQFDQLNSVVTSNRYQDAKTLAFITFDETLIHKSKARVVFRSHNNLIALAIPMIIEANIKAGSKMISSFSQSSILGVAGCFIPAFLTGTFLRLHIFSSLLKYRRELEYRPADFVCIPGRYLASMIKSLSNIKTNTKLIAMDTTGQDKTISLVGYNNLSVVHVISLGEAGFIPLKCISCYPEVINTGNLLTGSSKNTINYGEIELDYNIKTEKNIVAIKGPGVPDCKAMDAFLGYKLSMMMPYNKRGFMLTEFNADYLEPKRIYFKAMLKARDIVYVGRAGVDCLELDHLLSHMPQLADVACYPYQTLGGSRLGVAVVLHNNAVISIQELRDYLAKHGLGYYKLPVVLKVLNFIFRDHKGRPERSAMGLVGFQEKKHSWLKVV